MAAADREALLAALQAKVQRLQAVRELRKRQLAAVEVEIGAVYDQIMPLMHFPQ